MNESRLPLRIPGVFSIYTAQGCAYIRIPRNRWFVVHWWTKAVR